MKKATFNIAIRNGKEWIAKEVSGYIYTVGGDLVGVHGWNGHWTVSDLLTGGKVADGKTVQKSVLSAMGKVPALREAREYFKNNHKDILKVVGYNPDKYTDCTYQLLTVKPI